MSNFQGNHSICIKFVQFVQYRCEMRVEVSSMQLDGWLHIRVRGRVRKRPWTDSESNLHHRVGEALSPFNQQKYKLYVQNNIFYSI